MGSEEASCEAGWQSHKNNLPGYSGSPAPRGNEEHRRPWERRASGESSVALCGLERESGFKFLPCFGQEAPHVCFLPAPIFRGRGESTLPSFLYRDVFFQEQSSERMVPPPPAPHDTSLSQPFKGL